MKVTVHQTDIQTGQGDTEPSGPYSVYVRGCWKEKKSLAGDIFADATSCITRVLSPNVTLRDRPT
jgi:hypothetical protein